MMNGGFQSGSEPSSPHAHLARSVPQYPSHPPLPSSNPTSLRFRRLIPLPPRKWHPLQPLRRFRRQVTSSSRRFQDDRGERIRVSAEHVEGAGVRYCEKGSVVCNQKLVVFPNPNSKDPGGTLWLGSVETVFLHCVLGAYVFMVCLRQEGNENLSFKVKGGIFVDLGVSIEWCLV